MNNLIILTVFIKVTNVLNQENAGTNVALFLYHCYNKTENLLRDNRPATTINEVIELIVKIESSSSLQNDRELSKEIIHRFKQDGISRQDKVVESKYTIPYSPKEYQAYKNRILLETLIPGSDVLFPNETLTELQRCSLHFMLSSSIDNKKRDDEVSTCKRFAQYVRRIRREVDPNDEVELFDPVQKSPLKGQLQDANNNKAAEDILPANSYISATRIGDGSSDCPLENGVVYTKWGAVSPGTVIAGIAAGRTPQEIQHKGRTINNIFAATLVGDIAEVALQQGSSGKEPIVIGASGGWNSIETPRSFYLEKGERGTAYEMTDAEIRGGLDGLILGVNMKEWHAKVPLLKVSQILDMYYSPRGVLSRKYRACNRKMLFTEVAPLDKLIQQAIAFSFMLNERAILPGTISGDGIEAYSTEAAKSLFDYVVNKLSDISCAVDDDIIQRISTDIIIAIDSAWDYTVAQKTLVNLLNSLDINKYDSTYTIVNGRDGSMIVDSSFSVDDLNTKFNKEHHYMAPKGSDADKVLESVEDIIRRIMNNDKSSKKAGGSSHILLYLKYDPLNDSEKMKVNNRKQNIRRLIPDLKILTLGRGSKNAYADLVFNPTYDTFSITDTSISESLKPIIERIRQIPRRIVNPNCGPDFSGSTSVSESLDQYVEPYGINFYRVAPNYLFGEGTKTIRIRGYGYGNLVACTSRVNSRPLNATQDNVQCESISTSQEVAFALENPCKGFDSPMECIPAFLSVQAKTVGTQSTVFPCSDSGCRFPDNIKYSIVVEGLGCDSNGSKRIRSIISFLAVILVVRLILFVN